MPKRLLQKKPVKFILEMTDLYFSKHISRSAAELAYFLILSFFPLLICVNAFIVLLPVDLEAVLAAAAPLLPKAACDILGEYVGYITTNQSPGLLAAGIFMTLFFASAAFRALMNIMEEIYSRKGYRGFRQVVASVLFAGGGAAAPFGCGRAALGLAVDAFSAAVFAGVPLCAAGLPDGRPPGKATSPHHDRRLPGGGGPVGVLHPLLLVHRPVLPVLPGIRVIGLHHHPAGVALPVRQHPDSGQRIQLRVV